MFASKRLKNIVKSLKLAELIAMTQFMRNFSDINYPVTSLYLDHCTHVIFDKQHACLFVYLFFFFVYAYTLV